MSAYTKTIAKFPNGIERKIQYNPRTRSAYWTTSVGGVTKSFSGKLLQSGTFKFAERAEEQFFLSNYKLHRLSYDNYDLTSEEKYAESKKRKAAKMQEFRVANPDSVLCADGEVRRIYYTSFTKTSGFITKSDNGKARSVYGRVHNSIFTHNQKYNYLFN